MAKQIVGFRTEWKDKLKEAADSQRRTLSEVVEFIVDAHFKSLGYRPPLIDQCNEIENRQAVQE